MFVETSFFGNAVENLSFEQRIAMLAHGITSSKQIDSLDEAIRTLAIIVEEYQNSSAESNKRTQRDAKSVINFLHAMFLTSGQKAFALRIEEMSNKETGEDVQKKICSKLNGKSLQVTCYQIMIRSALGDTPKRVIRDIAQRVEDTSTPYEKFILVTPAVSAIKEYKKSHPTK